MKHDVIVIGSGFGGSVMAARLAQKGFNALILERGPWWGLKEEKLPDHSRRDFPRSVRTAANVLRNVRVSRFGIERDLLLNKYGLFEMHAFDRLTVATGSGVGGGSLIYTNIMEQPEDAFFDAFPQEITGAEMRPYFDRVREVLRPSPLPVRPDKNKAFESALNQAGLGAPKYPDLAVAWGDDPAAPETHTNAVGVSQTSCNYCGTCVLGCETRAKTTLDMTYIPLALQCGAELRPMSEVQAIGRRGNRYQVRWVDHRNGKQMQAEAPRAIVAAGALNTLRLLFAARDRHHSLPAISRSLGKRFSANGDMAAFLFNSTKLKDGSRGPSFNAFVNLHNDGGAEFLIGEVGVPLQALNLPALIRSKLKKSAILICMGRDGGNGEVRFGRRNLKISAGRNLDRDLFDRMEKAVARLAKAYGCKMALINLPGGRGREDIATVHPLGGAAIADSPERGVVDHKGQVFYYPGLYVADGSLCPAPPGLPPSMTIAALAERQAHLMEESV